MGTQKYYSLHSTILFLALLAASLENVDSIKCQKQEYGEGKLLQV